MKPHKDTGDNRDVCRFRLEKAKADLKTAKMLLETQMYDGVNNRAYYAIFHAINAVHALDGNAYKTHKSTLGNFNKDYIRTEVFPKSFGRRIMDASVVRNDSDYSDFAVSTREKAEYLIATASELIPLIEAYCQNRMGG